MKTSKQLLILIFLLAIGNAIFTSCDKKEVVFDAVGDIYVVKRILNNEIVYAPTYYLYGNKSMSSVTVTPPEGETDAFSLEAYQNNTYTFYKGIDENDFSLTKPTVGNYTFDVIDAEGTVFQSSDLFGNNEIDLPVITEVTYDVNNSYFYLSWDLVTNADAYNIKLFDSDGELVYNSVALTSTSDEFSITANDGYWLETPSNNKIYSFELNAFLFDSDATDNDWSYNIQLIAVADTVATWNPL